MSDSEQNTIIDKIFCVEVAKQGRAACKKCKQKCAQGELRIAKLAPSPYGSGFMKNWHHVDCIFEASMKQRATTKRLQDPEEDLDGWDDLSADNQAMIVEKINDCEKLFAEKNKLDFKPIKYDKKKTPKKTQPAVSPGKKKAATPNKTEQAGTSKADTNKYTESTFRDFRKLLANITNVSSYTDKTAAVAKVLASGTFKGDVSLWCRLLLPGVLKRIYNVQSKQLVKLFSRIFNTNQEEMLEDLEKGDIGETIETFFNQSKYLKPASSSTLTLEEVDEFLEKLSTLTKEDEQSLHFKEFCRKCTANDLKVVIRLVKHDLRINAGAKHILEAIHPDAYKAYQASRDLNAVLAKCLSLDNAQVTASITVMTPVLPMLAEACKSVEQAMKKCPNGMYSEIKYDGERVQLHKSGSEFKYYSRSLKPVLGHKIAHFKDYIPKAFPHAKDLILDCEVLMVDTNTGKPLPFGTLGKHKKNAFEDASVCLFVFDCIYYNGEDLTNKPLDLRKKMLNDSMVEIKNHVMFSEMEIIHKSSDLSVMIAKVLKLGLEGLVLKDIKSIYKPGKRHWLKVKKDYLFGGAMADSADLIVLGAWYGTGKKGGMMSVFLMGCYDPYTKRYKTVTKVHTGHDDETLERLQKELDMVKISCDIDKVPKWLDCTRTMIPDFVAKDPKAQPVWEITGAEFSQVYDVHTADGISIRFPRVTRLRDDKTWETATNLQELNVLYKNSKDTDVSLLLKNVNSDDQDIKSDPDDDSPKKNAKKRSITTAIVESPKKKIKLELKTPRSVTIQNPLPDYFDGVRLLLEEGTKDKYPELLRHFIAYSGQVLSERNCLKANYVLHGSEMVEDQYVLCSKSAKHITADWIKECIIRKEQLDYEKYAVIYIPKENYADFD